VRRLLVSCTALTLMACGTAALADFDTYNLQGPQQYVQCSASAREHASSPMQLTYNAVTNELAYITKSGKTEKHKLQPCAGGPTPLCVESNGGAHKAFFTTDSKTHTITLKALITIKPTPSTCLFNAVYKDAKYN